MRDGACTCLPTPPFVEIRQPASHPLQPSAATMRHPETSRAAIAPLKPKTDLPLTTPVQSIIPATFDVLL